MEGKKKEEETFECLKTLKAEQAIDRSCNMQDQGKYG